MELTEGSFLSGRVISRVISNLPSLGKVKPSVQGELERGGSHLLNPPTLYSLMKLYHKHSTRGRFLENSQEHGSCRIEKNKQEQSPWCLLEKVNPVSMRVGHAVTKTEGRLCARH